MKASLLLLPSGFCLSSYWLYSCSFFSFFFCRVSRCRTVMFCDTIALKVTLASLWSLWCDFYSFCLEVVSSWPSLLPSVLLFEPFSLEADP